MTSPEPLLEGETERDGLQFSEGFLGKRHEFKVSNPTRWQNIAKQRNRCFGD